MKTTKNSSVAVRSYFLASLAKVLAKTNLQFTGISVTDEGAMHIAWSSTNHQSL